MAAETRGLVTGDTFIFTAHVAPRGERSRAVAVAFVASAKFSGASVSNQLRDFFATSPLSAELWIVAPTFALEDLRSVRESAAFRERLQHAATLDAVRLVTFDSAGFWEEVDRPDHHDDLVTTDVVDFVRAEGLRVMFREGHGLMEAHAGLHYAKPSGSHTRLFLRAGPVVARSPQTMFAAVCLLPWASARRFERIWVDTSAIAGVGFALSALLSMFSGRPTLVPVDSFGGYGRLVNNPPDPSDQPLVLISASTSGRLAREISRDHGIDAGDIATLFFVGADSFGFVLCDLTRTPTDETDDYKIDPIQSWDADTCELCAEGLTTITLEGEEFVPEATRATARMLKAVYSGKNLSPFMRQFLGTGAIRVSRTTDAQSGHARTLDIRLAPLLRDRGDIHDRVITELKRHLPAQTRWIITLGDPDSNALAELAAQLCRKVGLANVGIVGPEQLDAQTQLGDGHAFVVAGAVASGRSLLNISRQLRYLHSDHIHYFVICARPRSESAWKSLVSDLRYGETPQFYPLNHVWLVESEPDRRALNPWRLEAGALRRVASRLPQTHKTSTADGTADAVNARLEELTDVSRVEDLILFPAADYGRERGSLLELNPNFAFWSFRFEQLAAYRDGARPTQDEVFFTMSTVLHNFRYSTEGRYALFGLPGHGYVLDPLNFGRFNDPVIQAAILRAAKGVELDYTAHAETSAQMGDLVLDTLAHRSDLQYGGAAAEFALAIARGLEDKDAPGALRLHSDDLRRVGAIADQIQVDEAPLLTALLRYIQSFANT